MRSWLRGVSVVSAAGLVAGLLSVVGLAVTAVPAGAVGCPAWVNVDAALECTVNGPVFPGTPPAGGWIFAKTLRVTAGGSINAENADGSGFEAHVTGDVILDGGNPGGIIQADDTGVVPGDSTPAQPIWITATGNMSMGAGSRISADNLNKLGEGGDIRIDVGKAADGVTDIPGNHTMDMLGTAGTDSCRTFNGPHPTIYQYGLNNTPNVYDNVSLGARISSVRYGGAGSSSGGQIDITVGKYGVPPLGAFTMQRCSLVDVSSLGSGGVINITAGKTALIEGLVLSESAQSGSGNSQNSPRGGGPINIRAGCELTVSKTGMVSSKGQDQGADLVHLKGCTVFIAGIVQSTAPGAGHVVPVDNFVPANLCNNDAVAHPKGSAEGFTGCVRILGQTVTIDGKAPNNGQVNVDGIRAPMRGWIDIFATRDISIAGDTPPDPDLGPPAGRHPGWAVEADACPVGSNGSPPCSNSFGGVITIKSIGGKVVTSGQAVLQANAGAIGGDGGLVTIQAGGNGPGTPVTPNPTSNIELDGSFLEADGVGGENGNGGTINIKSFNGAITSLGDASGHIEALGGPTSVADPLGNGVITLVECAPTDTYLGAVTAENVTETRSVCGGFPTVPADAQALLDANAPIWEACTFQAGLKSGLKWNDLNGNGIKDVGEPTIAGWPINLLNTSNVVQQSTVTDANGNYTFNIGTPGTYRVCEGTGPAGFVQTFPNATTVRPDETIISTCPLPNIWGYEFVIASATILENNNFGNWIPCQKPTVIGRMNSVYPGNLGPDTWVKVYAPLNESVQDAVDKASDTNNDGYIIVFVLGKADGSLGGSANQKVNVWKDYEQLYPGKPFGLLACSVTLTGGGSGPAVQISKTAESGYTSANGRGGYIFMMDLHGANSAVGVQIDSTGGYSRYLDNTAATGNTVGIKVIGNGNTVHNGVASNNKSDGVSVAGSSNLLTDTDAMGNGGHGFNVWGDSNQLLKLDAGDKGKGNKQDGAHVYGKTNTLSEIGAFANSASGIYAGGTGNVLNKNVSGDKGKENGIGFTITGEAGAANSLQENSATQGTDYVLKGVGPLNKGGKNKADGSVAGDPNAKCKTTFPKINTAAPIGTCT